VILYCGPNCPLLTFIMSQGETVRHTEAPITQAMMTNIEFLVSVNYRYKIESDVLRMLPPISAINGHISLLPFNRGADPNFWSWAEDTLKGVSIHEVDDDWDTGPLLAQQVVLLDEDAHTLASSYAALQAVLSQLFRTQWHALRGRCLLPVRQVSGGSFHRKADRAKIAHLLEPDGWNTPVSRLVEYCAETQLTEQEQRHA
jgi:methionyl-tRNA formyltransferase